LSVVGELHAEKAFAIGSAAITARATKREFDLSARNFLVFHSLPQTLGLVAPSPIGLWSPEHGAAEDDKRCDHNERDNQNHLRLSLSVYGRSK
jgi:hypothetical protein